MTTDFIKRIKRAKGNVEIIEREWAEARAEFAKSLNGKSKNELIDQLCDYFLQIQFYESKATLLDEMMDEDKKFVKQMGRYVTRSKAEYRSLGKEALQTVNALSKRIDYLENILGQRTGKIHNFANNLAAGRKKGIDNRKSKSKALVSDLEQAIKDYWVAHQDHKVGNKEVEQFIAKSGFVGSKAYSEKTLQRKVASILAKIRRESSSQ